MLGGINNSLFFQSFGGFLVLPILILFLRWAFPTKKDPAERARKRELKKSLQELKRK
jgi:hypothetical protein